MLGRAISALRRAQSLLLNAGGDPQQLQRVNDLVADLERRDRDLVLIAELRKVWEWEMDQLAERDADIRQVVNSPNIVASPGGAISNQYLQPANDSASTSRISSGGLYEAAEKYAAAFSKWGLAPAETPIKEAIARIHSLPEMDRPLVYVTLDHWRHLLSTPRPFGQWTNAAWQILEPVELKSKGGDKLEVLDDKSILAGGDHPEFGYDLLLETTQKSITALRLEVLRHNSLPSGGPRRNPAGIFAYDGMTIHYASQSDSKVLHPLRLRSAVGSYSWDRFPLTTSSWNSTYGIGKSHVAVFELAEPIQNEFGFRFRMQKKIYGTGDDHRVNNFLVSLGQKSWQLYIAGDYQLAIQLSRLAAEFDKTTSGRQVHPIMHNSLTNRGRKLA